MTSNKQSLHFIDKLVGEILAWAKKQDTAQLHVDDMKTPSGRVHTGSIRGVLLHDMVAKALREKFDQVESTYVFNDFDPMDGLPGYLDQEEYSQHMGKPLFMIPKPELDKCGINLDTANAQELADFKNAQNFAEVYAYDFIHAFRKLGCSQKIIYSSQLYKSGQMDAAIKISLESAQQMRKIYQEVADYQLPERWFPFQVVCEKCGKLGTTLVTDWDGSQVSYHCQKNKVDWATGCEYQSKISPFGGTGKLLWKVDWPAHWQVLGINIEGAGKDHTSSGGSRDMANAMCENVFNITPPFDIPYEWILVRGAKMSSSKGIGTSAREFTNLFPPEVGRFLFASKNYGQVIDFDPYSMAIADLFDEYDAAAEIFWGKKQGDTRLARSFELSQIKGVTEPHFLPRFRDIANFMQYPEIDLIEKFTTIKGSQLEKIELNELNDRIKYAKIWLNVYAPDEYRLTITKDVPTEARNFTKQQKEFLQAVGKLIDSKDWQPQDLQQAIFDLAKSSLGAKLGFQTIYLAFLGKTSGPKAAWFLLNLSSEERNHRIDQII